MTNRLAQGLFLSLLLGFMLWMLLFGGGGKA